MKLTAIEPGIEAIVSSIRHIGLRHGDLQTIVPLAKSAVCTLPYLAPFSYFRQLPHHEGVSERQCAIHKRVGRTAGSIWFMTSRHTFVLGLRCPVNGFSLSPKLAALVMIVRLTRGGGLLRMTS